MSFLELEEVRALGLGAELEDDSLQAAIDEEEAWLARRIGPLAGERTQHFGLVALRPIGSEVHLRRPTDTIEAEQDGADVTDLVELRGDGWIVGYLPAGSRWLGPTLDVTYTPNDELEVSRALKELLGLQLSMPGSSGLQSEIMGSYSWTRASGSSTKIRRSIVAGLREPASAHSSRLLSSIPHGVAGRLGR